jgi:hypothetical protein
MQDKVGSKIPSEKDIQKLIDDLKSIENRIAEYTITLTSDERQATTKMRIGGEEVVATVGHLATEHSLTLPEISVDGMNADLLLAKRLRPLATAATALAQRLDDTILQAQSECWWAATAYYSTLARISGANAKLQASLKPVVDFFAIGRRKPKAPKPE